MATFKGHGLRGSTLEDILNRTGECYRRKGLALIQKVPTPITPVEMNRERQITLAYFEKKSTVDYIGAIQGLPVCFDAKECQSDTFPLQNVHEHQIEFMKDFEAQGGISFFILMYTARSEFYFVPLSELMRFWERMEQGGRKSFTYEELDRRYRLRSKGEYLCHYLEGLAAYLEDREKSAAEEASAPMQ